jgi:2-dehydro-3-deoxygluconokinase
MHDMAHSDIITFGETMALMMPSGSKGIEQSKLFDGSFGGAESNLAIGLARLGIASGWFGHLGNDPLGRMILKGIRGEGVDVSKVKLVDGEPTGLMLRDMAWGRSSVYYYRKLSAASKMMPEHLDEEYIKHAKILHVTGITPALSESCKQTVLAAVELAKKHGVKVSFDPNLRLKLWTMEEARPVLQQLAEQADYYLPGYDELQLLYSTEDFDTIITELRKLSAVSIVKGHGNETLIVHKDVIERVPFFPVKQVVDTVGAGDGFCAGYLSGIVRGQSQMEAVRIGSLIGSLVVQGAGDWESIPSLAMVEAELGLRKHVER